MRLTFSPDIISLFDLIRTELKQGRNLFLVGGAVRDSILDREINDLDFVMGDNPTSLAKRVARRLKMNYFVLDDERHTARVLYRTSEGNLSPLDFVQFTGGDLEEDLRNRDFTINAMAVSLRDFESLLDPLNGRADLSERLIRPCSDHALLDDPVRVLRGIRLALQFDFGFIEELHPQMHAAAGFLTATSYERQRDEFFKILEGPNPGEGMRYCRQFKVFDTLIPPLIEQEDIPASPPHTQPLFDHSIATVEYFGKLMDWIESGDAVQNESPWWISYVITELSQFSSEIGSFFAEEVTLGRSKRSLALLATLLHDIGKPLTMKMGEDDRLHYYGHARVGADLAWDAARRLQLSNAEADWIETIVRWHMDLLPLVNEKQPLSRKSIYRFFKRTQEVGIAIAILSLADTLATFGDTLTHEKWEMAVRVTKELFNAWWERKEALISPSILLDGHDLQKEFGLEPGKQIGQLLEALREAQAVGKVTDQEEAKAFIRSRMDQIKCGGKNESND